MKLTRPGAFGRQWSVRAYLLVLVLGVAVLLTALLGTTLYLGARQEERQATNVALQLALIAAAEASHIAGDARTLLANLAERPGVRSLDSSHCDDILNQYDIAFPTYANLALFDLEGRLVCSAMPTTLQSVPAEQDWFRAVREQRNFFVSAPYSGDLGKSSVVAFVQPVFDVKGDMRGELVAFFDQLRYRPGAVLATQISPRAVISIVNRQGTVIARSKEPGELGELKAQENEIIAAALRQQHGTARAKAQAMDALLAVVPVEGTPWFAAAAIPAHEVVTATRAAVVRSAAVTLGVLLLVAAGAWWLASRISRPIQDIAQAARVVGEGARERRADVSGPTEIREVAQSFNEMLDRRDAAERGLRESNRALALVQEASAAGIWDWELATGKITYSRRFKDLLGYQDEDEAFVRDFAFRECLHPSDRDRVMAAIDRHLAKDELFDEEFRLRDRYGVHRWFSGRGLALRDGSGKALRFAGSITDITQGKRAEFELTESKERFELAVRGTADGIWDWDIAHSGYYISPQYKTLLGYGNDELSNSRQSFLQHLHPDDVERITAAVNAHLEHRAVYDAEYRLRCKDGSYRWFRGRGQAVWDAEGRPMRMAGSVSDITARKQAEAELRQSERLFREMSDSSPAFIWLADTDGKYFYVNRPWLEFTGRKLEDELGEGWLDGVHADDITHFRRDYRDAFLSRRAFRFEYRVRRHDGEYRWLLDQGVPRYDEHGSFIGYLGSCVDITDRVEANERIHRLSDMYAALSQVNDAIARGNDQQRLFERVCQITARFGSFVSVWIGLIDEGKEHLRTAAYGGESIGQFNGLVIPLVSGETSLRNPAVTAVLNNRHEICNDSGPHECGFRAHTTPAVQRVKAAAAFPLKRGGQVIGVFVAYSDETGFFDREISHLLLDLANNLSFALDSLAAEARRQKAEEEIRELNATLEQRVQERTLSLEAANRELEAFSYSVSHDLRAPLRGISGFSDLLMEKYSEDLDEEGRQYLTRVKNASHRMASLINDMLALARIARTELNCRPLDLTALAEEVIAEMRQHEPQRKVEVKIARKLSVVADSVLMRSVFENLLGNAWKFTSKRELATIDVGVAERAGQQVYFVRDNGAGFNMAYADKLFAPFQRLHSEKDFSGTGVGLATVQRIVHRHNGHIWCEATEGSGACFYFTLAT